MPEPAETVVLIGVLRAAEDHDGVVAPRCVGRASLGHMPALEDVSPASTASSKTPPGTLGPCVTERTRIGTTLAQVLVG